MTGFKRIGGTSKLQKFKEKISKDNIDFTERYDDDGELEAMSLLLPNGENKRKVYVSEYSVDALNDIELTQYRFLGDYDAIIHREGGYIEAAVSPVSPRASFLLGRLLEHSKGELDGVSDDEETLEADDKVSSQISCNRHGITIELVAPGDAIAALIKVPRARTCLRISGARVHKDADALSILERVSNAFFFNFELNFGISLSLRRTRNRIGRPIRNKPELQEAAISFPTHEYDPEPLSLYWYSRSAEGMPLLEFLALYQVIEYYFPAYSKREAGKRIQNIIKDPAFQADRDRDINRLLLAIGGSARGTFGAERDQLKATISQCVDPKELLDFLCENEDENRFSPASTRR